jgi:beta-N-acetylhexosaminidase
LGWFSPEFLSSRYLPAAPQQAGADIIIFENNLVYDEDIAQKARDTILNLVAKGRVPGSQIQEAYDRIMELKGRLK